eukprot:1787632-Rhodomonas_salina.1
MHPLLPYLPPSALFALLCVLPERAASVGTDTARAAARKDKKGADSSSQTVEPPSCCECKKKN